MSPEELRSYCLDKPGAWPDEPWDGDTVAKVHVRIFAFLGTGTPLTVGLKAGSSRAEAAEWLARYPDDVTVMPYIGRSGWNTLTIGAAIPDDEVREAIDASYDAVIAKIPRKHRPPC